MSRYLHQASKAAWLLPLIFLSACTTLPTDRPVWQRNPCDMSPKAQGVGYDNQANLRKMLERKEDICKGQALAPAPAGPAMHAIDTLIKGVSEGQAAGSAQNMTATTSSMGDN